MLKLILSFKPARIPPKEISGASGGFLPKPLLLRLRHPNSKTNQSKFWQILSSPKNSFAKTSSALKPRHTARILGGQNPKKKNVLSILEKIHPRENQKSKEHFFFLGLPSEARRWRGFRRAYGLISSHHALRACHIIYFGNRGEFGTIETPDDTFPIFGRGCLAPRLRSGLGLAALRKAQSRIIPRRRKRKGSGWGISKINNLRNYAQTKIFSLRS